VVGSAAAILISSEAYERFMAHQRRNGIEYPYSWFGANAYFRSIADNTANCRPVVLFFGRTALTANSLASRVGGPQWLSTLDRREMPREDFLRALAPGLIGASDDVYGKSAYIFTGRGCRLNLCAATIYGQLDLRQPARCSGS